MMSQPQQTATSQQAAAPSEANSVHPGDNEVLLPMKKTSELTYVKRRLMDLPDWAIAKPNLIFGFTTIANEEIHAEELVALMRPRFMDKQGNQVHEDASYEWQAQSPYRANQLGEKAFDFGSRDQDLHDLSLIHI